jgi:acyl dehydratase
MRPRDPKDIYPGKELGRRDFVLTEADLEHYFAGLQLDRARYRERSPYSRPVAPSMAITAIEDRFMGAIVLNPFGTLWRRQEWTLRAPSVPGERYEASARVAQVYEHRGRTIVAMETTLRTPDGRLVAQGVHHQSFVLGQTSGQVALRPPERKEGAGSFAPPKGEALEPVTRTITLEMCQTFFHGERSYHTQRERSEGMGFREVVVGGRMTIAYLGEMLDRRFGRGWYEQGNMDVKFTNVVWPGDSVTARGMVTGRAQDGGAPVPHAERSRSDRSATLAQVTVWVEKADWAIAIVGTATARDTSS